MYSACTSLQDNSAVVRLLLQRGAKVDQRDSHGNTALLRAVQTNLVDSIKVLLEFGADVNIINDYGQTPLLISMGMSATIPGLLLAHGANLNYASPHRSPLLWRAIDIYSDTKVRLLLDAGANPTIRYREYLGDDETPRQYAQRLRSQTPEAHCSTFATGLDNIISMLIEAQEAWYQKHGKSSHWEESNMSEKCLPRRKSL